MKTLRGGLESEAAVQKRTCLSVIRLPQAFSLRVDRYHGDRVGRVGQQIPQDGASRAPGHLFLRPDRNDTLLDTGFRRDPGYNERYSPAGGEATTTTVLPFPPRRQRTPRRRGGTGARCPRRAPSALSGSWWWGRSPSGSSPHPRPLAGRTGEEMSSARRSFSDRGTPRESSARPNADSPLTRLSIFRLALSFHVRVHGDHQIGRAHV